MQSAQARKLWPMFQKLSGYILQVYDRIDLKSQKKKDTMSFVTRCEETIEEMIKEELAAYTPEVPVYSEGELDDVSEIQDDAWVIDPIDGTTNFLNKVPLFTISLAYYENGKLTRSYVYDVMNDVYYYAQAGQGAFANQARLRLGQVAGECIVVQERGAVLPERMVNDPRVHIRSIGSVSLGLCWLAEGKSHLFITKSARITDVAGALLIVKEAGGIIKSLNKDNDEDYKSGMVSAHPTLLGKVLAEMTTS